VRRSMRSTADQLTVGVKFSDAEPATQGQ